MLSQLKKDLAKKGRADKIAIYANFFKTGPGQYGEGDKFIGVTMPDIRSVANAYKDLGFNDIQKLLLSPIHEERMCATVILVNQYKGNEKKVFDFYCKHFKRFNNWDFVDVSADKIVGAYLFDKDRNLLYTLAKSKNLWERRISIISTFYFIRKEEFTDTLAISEILMQDGHDLIHKAVGWMLREVGKKDQPVLEQFLDKYCTAMPRTMLRYAIEKFPEKERKYYMTKQG